MLKGVITEESIVRVSADRARESTVKENTFRRSELAVIEGTIVEENAPKGSETTVLTYMCR